eukprot:5655852-Prymnesium_polylepis.1
MNASRSSSAQRGLMSALGPPLRRSVSCQGSSESVRTEAPKRVHNDARTKTENRDSVSAILGDAQRAWLVILSSPGLSLDGSGGYTGTATTAAYRQPRKAAMNERPGDLRAPLVLEPARNKLCLGGEICVAPHRFLFAVEIEPAQGRAPGRLGAPVEQT